ncbi:MAG: hypothetical protein ACJA08_003599 [Cyclobacteriaceae bacterium]|jgi:hypothetical protein
MKSNIPNIYFFLIFIMTLSSCNDTDEPVIENEQEIITDVVLTFTDIAGNAISAMAIDPDGEGFANLEVVDTIELKINTIYTLAIELENSVTNESLTSEVKNESDEHLFFFSFTEDIFSDPIGNGNMDQREDALNYLDKDEFEFPLGLSTRWTTAGANKGKFRVVLKHQPGIKSVSSTVTDGESDVDLEWVVVISE